MEDRSRFSETGDTLIEVLLALVVLGLAATALLAGFATAISASANHRDLTNLDASSRTAVNEAISLVQQNASKSFPCPDPYNPFTDPANTLPASLSGAFTVTNYQVTYWNGSTFSANGCTSTPTAPDYGPQQVTMTVASKNYSSTISTVIYDPQAPVPTGSAGAPAYLVWLESPTSGTVGAPVSPQPQIQVVDAAGNPVDNDLSPLTLKVSPLSTGTGTLSKTCSAVEGNSVFPFGDCSLSAAGQYTLQAVDGTLTAPGGGPALSSSFMVTPAPAAKLAFTTKSLSGTASSGASLGLITIQEQDSLNNPVTGAATIGLTSSSGTGVFSLTPNGAPTTSVTIPAGSSTVSFYYGDTTAGSPTITANSNGLAPASQAETINAGAATKLAFTSNPFTAGQGSSANNQFTVALEDTFGNQTTTAGNTTVNLTSTSGTGKFSRTSGGNSATSVTITAGNSTVNAYYGDTTVGTPTITAAANGLTSATQTETITLVPTKLVFTTNPLSGTATSSATLGPITVQEQAANGTPTTVAESVNVSSSSSTGAFALTSGGTTSKTLTVTIPAGSSSATFYYADTKTGTPTITAATTGLTSATQTETIATGPMAGFNLSTPSPTAGAPFTETITAVDQFGNTVTNYTSSQAPIFSGPDNSPNGSAPIYPSSLTFTNGVAPAQITLFDAESTALKVAIGTFSGLATFTVNAGPVAAFSVPTPSTQTVGVAFNVSINATDAYGNAFTGTVTPMTFSGPSNSPAPLSRAPKYPTSVTFNNGAGTASVTLYDAQATTLTVGTTGVSATTGSFSVNAAGASQLAFSTQPGGTVGEGVAFTTQPAVTAEDAFDNTVSGVPVTLNIAGYTAGNGGTTRGALSACTNPVTTGASGIAAFNGCGITGNGAAGTYTFNATAPGATASPISNNVTITAGTATQLVFSTQPAGTVKEGTAFTTQPKVTVQDANGNAATGYTTGVSLHISTYAAGNGGTTQGTLAGCTAAVIPVNGVATFSGCDITGNAGAGTYTLNATSGGLPTSANSNTVTITAGTASQLTFSTQPAGTVAENVNFTTQPAVTAQDASGNAVSGLVVTLNIASYAAGNGGTTQGTLNCTNNSATTLATGVATFTGCDVEGTAAAGTYTFNASAAGVPTSANSNSVTITAGTGSKLVFTTQPVGGVTEGTAFTTQPKVTVQDANGNAATGYTTGVSLHISTYAAGNGGTTQGTLAGCTAAVIPVNGVATFSGCDITGNAGAGTYTLNATSGGLPTSANSNTVTITAGTASQLTFSTQPAGTVAESANFTAQPKVSAQDASGNAVTGLAVTLNIAGYTAGNGGTTQGTLNCTANTVTISAITGVAAFTGCDIEGTAAAGTYTFNATAAGVPTSANSNSVTIVAGTAAQLIFSTQPGGAPVTEGTPFPTQPKVSVLDGNGNTVAGYTTGVSLHISTYAAGNGGTTQGTLGGCTAAVTPVNGVATFSGCDITGPAAAGTYTFLASSGSLPNSSASGSVAITAGTASQLVFSTQPVGGVTEGTAFATQPKVTAEDTNGNAVTSFGNGITLHISTYAAGNGGTTQGTLGGCTAAVTPVNGAATFSGCDITGTAGAGTYTVNATATSVPTSANSSNIGIVAGTAQLTFSTQPAGSVTENTNFTTQPSVTAKDASGNAVSGLAVTLNISTYTAGNGGTTQGSLNCANNTLTTSATGIAAFTTCDIEGTAAAGTYNFNATATGVPTSANSNNVTITAGAANTITIVSGSGQSAARGNAFANPLVAKVTDANGNGVSGATVTFTAPTNGATVAFAAAGCTNLPHTYQCQVTTNASGQATSSTMTASNTRGNNYNISGAVLGATNVTYKETNT